MSKFLIIIPCYNEEERIQLSEFREFLNDPTNQEFNFLFVNDGSKDGTAALLSDFCSSNSSASFLDIEKNVGKAEAIRMGVNSIKSDLDYIGYFDADLATPLKELNRFVSLSIEKNQPYLIMGSRIKILGMTKIDRKLSRHYIGRIFATIVSNMLKIPVYDTQCGAKLIRADYAKMIFQLPFSSKWLFDVELLFRLKKSNSNLEGKIIEVPLYEWEDKAGSKIKLSYYFQAPLDLLRIYFRYN